MSVEFQDFSIQVKEALNEAALIGLELAASEIKTQAARNSRTDTGHLKGSWEYVVDESAYKATIGSPLENAIWEEFGTGEYATEGSRGGYWVFVKGGDSGGNKKLGKRYSLEKAKQIVAMMRADGLDAYYTKGKKPNHTLQKAFESKKNAAIRLIKRSVKESMK